MLRRLFPLAMMLSVLGGCVATIDLNYDVMDKSAPVAGASGVTIDLNTGSDTDTGWESSGDLALKVETVRPVSETLANALQTELKNRGFSFGKGPRAVQVLARVTALEFSSYQRGAVANVYTDAAITLKVSGPGKVQYYENDYADSQLVKNAIFVTINGSITRVFSNAVHKAMADEKLFAAILKAHADAAAQSDLTPINPDRARQIVVSSS